MTVEGDELKWVADLHHEMWRSRSSPWAKQFDATELAGLLQHIPLARLIGALEIRALRWHTGPLGKPVAEFFPRVVRNEGEWAAYALASIDADGYIREGALQLLERSPAGAALKFALLRTNDWVAEVRSAGEKAFLACLEVATGADAIKALPLALTFVEQVNSTSLRAVERPATFARLLIARCARVDDGTLLAAHARSGHSARWAFEQLAERRSPRLNDAISLSLEAGDWLAQLAAVRAIALVAADARLALLQSALASRLGSVRAAALSPELVKELDNGIVGRALFDSHAGARAAAQRVLAARGEKNIAQKYRDRLADARGEECAIALTGLAEAGTEEDAAEAVIRTGDRSSQVRQAALRCLAKHAPQDASAAALEALRDKNPKVFRLAVSICIKTRPPGLATAVQALLATNTGHERFDLLRRRAGVRLTRALPIDEALPLLSSLLDDVLWRGRALHAMHRALFAASTVDRKISREALNVARARVQACTFGNDWRLAKQEHVRRQVLFLLDLATRESHPS